MPPVRKKRVQLPKAVWLVFIQTDGKVHDDCASVYVDHEDIGELQDDEVVAHYHLVEKNRPSKDN